MFLDWKNQDCENDYTTQSYLQIQCNPYQITNGIFKNTFYNIYLFIYFKFIFGCVGLCCCAWAFSSCGELGLLFVAVCRLLIVVASLAVEHGL